MPAFCASPALPVFLRSAKAPLSPRASPHPTLRPVPRLPKMTSTSPQTTTRPPRVVLPETPRVFVYDHCPFACRVRYTLGMKNIKHHVVWLMNDDVDTPTALVGKKVVPIFQPTGASGESVMESMDICGALDADARYGAPGHFRGASGREDISAWVSANAMTVRRLTRPRNVRAPLPEFVFADARDAFVRNHALPEPSDYEENFRNTEALLAELQPRMQELADCIYCAEYCTEGGLSMDDVDLFPRLRTLTIVKGLVLPEKIEKYLEFHSRMSEVPLYYCYAT